MFLPQLGDPEKMAEDDPALGFGRMRGKNGLQSQIRHGPGDPRPGDAGPTKTFQGFFNGQGRGPGLPLPGAQALQPVVFFGQVDQLKIERKGPGHGLGLSGGQPLDEGPKGRPGRRAGARPGGLGQLA